ncbi:MAG: hypothetical protein OXG85_12720 [Chloroflexi bacterium]|nr:hypothetical protein [Chloroflexota bacterium]
MDKRAVGELTVNELEEIIRRAVKNSVAEAMLELALEVDVEAQVAYEAEINELLRGELQACNATGELAHSAADKVDD